MAAVIKPSPSATPAQAYTNSGLRIAALPQWLDRDNR